MAHTEDLEFMASQNKTAWLSTTASQIFFMQLGFLCYEVGFVEAVWSQSVILKNIEDTFVGILTFVAFGYTLTESKHSFYGLISIPSNPLLIGIEAKHHNRVLISAFFATTCATIISGAVLERMKNKCYIVYCMLTILLNYSFVAHWIWHPNGWLAEMGFIDGAGAIAVHSTAGMASLVAIWRLGARRNSVDANGDLLPLPHAANPVINATGAFFLWYGWFAFNIASAVAYERDIGDALATAALVTVISPIASSCAAFVWMWSQIVSLSFESLLSCLLCGLVAITGVCHTCNIWSATVIGVLSSAVYFIGAHIVRDKWKLDDPIQVIATHLFCGVFSAIAEGIVANDTYHKAGLIHSGNWEHFGVQLLGVIIVCVFNFLLSLFVYEMIMNRVIFRKINMRVSILDIYLGTRLFDEDYEMAFDEVINCSTNAAKRMIWEFHDYLSKRYASEQLDFLIVVKIYELYLASMNQDWKADKYKIAKYILRIFNTYVDENGEKCINVSAKQRTILKRIKHQILVEINADNDDNDDKQTPIILSNIDSNKYGTTLDISTENIFKSAYISVWKLIMPHFTDFLQHAFDIEKEYKFEIKLPLKLDKDWIVEWDQMLMKQDEDMHLKDTIAKYNESATLLAQMLQEFEPNDRNFNDAPKAKTSGLQQIELSDYQPPNVSNSFVIQ